MTEARVLLACNSERLERIDTIEIRSLSTLRVIRISRAGLRDFGHRTAGRGSCASRCFTFQIKIFAPEPINHQNKDRSEEDKAERQSMANVPSKAESKDHDRARKEHSCSSQPYSNSMHCVSDLVSRHTHHRVQPGPKGSPDLILVRLAGETQQVIAAGLETNLSLQLELEAGS